MSVSKKVVTLGHFGVGKTSLIRRYVDSAFSEDYLVTVGVHVKKKDLEVNNEKVTLIIWDIEGNTSIDLARKSYLLGTSGFLYVFDVSRPETYEKLAKEKTYLDTHFKGIPVCTIGNKKDLLTEEAHQIFFEGESFKDCFFTSAKTGENVEEIFMEITTSMLSV